MNIQALPEPEDVRSLLHGLLGREVSVERLHPESIGLDTAVIVADYRRDDGNVAGVCVASLSAAAYCGASLSLLPKGIADESLGENVVYENLLENFQEVLNVAAAWFNGKGSPHASLAKVASAGQRPAQDVAQVMGTPAERLDLNVTIEGYGSGILRLLATSF